ncbi:MAG TPA: ribosome small subunit-dependent GTPase A [Puia sp.]|nr:ribosome small subunit-dependent GTPase A [Puia sp.]
MTGKIYKSTGSWYVVKTADGRFWNSRLRGLFKTDGITSTNPLAVGDDVDIQPEPGEEGSAVISGIHERNNYINRQSPHHRMQHHIVAANIDQSLLVATLKEPRTSQGFVDRFLVTCEAYHVPAVLLVNKTDLYRAKEREKLAEWLQMYPAIGYRVIPMSVKTGQGLDDAATLLTGKISLLSGHSGVGKSSFLNAAFPEMKLKTQEVSGWSGKGMHTTTFAEMLDLPADAEGSPRGQVIDTPGMREFGLVDITKAELSGYFPEMRVFAGGCQFNNCLHVEEPGCVVKDAVRDGRIAEDRYVSYRHILDSIDEKHY